MKKLLAFLLSLFLIFSLVACGPDTPDDSGPDTPGNDGGDGTPAVVGPEGDPAAPDMDWDGVV